MSSVASILQWPIASITIWFTKEGEGTSRELSAQDIEELVRSAIRNDERRATLRFAGNSYYQDKRGFSVGQSSQTLEEHQFVVIPEEEEQPFFFADHTYRAIRIVSCEWNASAGTRACTDNDIIAAALYFEARIRTAYEASISPDAGKDAVSLPESDTLPPWERPEFVALVSKANLADAAIRTPKEWMRLIYPNAKVVSKDGWQLPYQKSFREPIGRVEFLWRYQKAAS